MQMYFCFFLVSGFCSILYEVIWLRLTMAQFGVTTAMVSIVLSVFMVGLGIGSWASGSLIRRYEDRISFPALRLYALTELIIGISAVLVPLELSLGRKLLERAAGHHAMAPGEHYVLAGLWVAITLVPWCACMGATFPFAMLAIRKTPGMESNRSFSYLYLANVLGAVAGAAIPLLLIELLGFRHTLLVGAVLNFGLAIVAYVVSLRSTSSEAMPLTEQSRRIVQGGPASDKLRLLVLFGTGLTSMGVEVVWIRLYTPSLGTLVYAFAAILGLYLLATDFGSFAYRRGYRIEPRIALAALGFCTVFAFLTADPRLHMPGLIRAMLGVAPFSAIVGYITPMIVDEYAEGDPDRAGKAYAVNISGCTIGPLLAGFLFLPAFGEKFSLCFFAVPWLVAGLTNGRKSSVPSITTRRLGSALVLLASVAVIVFGLGFEEQFTPRRVMRDDTATTVATGSGMGKRLLINGVGITSLEPLTKVMAHLPLASLEHSPRNALIICFGMGTSYRSALSWQIPTTAVELVPSVPKLFTYYHSDGQSFLDSPLSHVVADDGRSYLEKSDEQYDVIVIDPPPPVGAAASSLLYSKEFYEVAKQHLHSGGILQQWLPTHDRENAASVVRAFQESFPNVRLFLVLDGEGYILLGSMSRIAPRTADELAERLPDRARQDFVQWGPATNARDEFEVLLGKERLAADVVADAPEVPALQDDRPFNEYFLIRWAKRTGSFQKLAHALLSDPSKQRSRDSQ
jgi:spermidine synthase